jgi:hypothetical protein
MHSACGDSQEDPFMRKLVLSALALLVTAGPAHAIWSDGPVGPLPTRYETPDPSWLIVFFICIMAVGLVAFAIETRRSRVDPPR